MVVPDIFLCPPVYSAVSAFESSSGVGSSSSGGVGGGGMSGRENGSEGVGRDVSVSSSTRDSNDYSGSSSSSSNNTARSTRIRGPNTTTGTSTSRNSKGQYVCLESALLKIAAAREVAYVQRKSQEEKANGLLAQLPEKNSYRYVYAVC